MTLDDKKLDVGLAYKINAKTFDLPFMFDIDRLQ